MKEEIDDTLCEICENQLILNYLERGPLSGICDECGAMYSYELEDSQITSVDFHVDFGIETQIISEYYEETGQRAYIILHVEHSEDEISEFREWVRENYPDLEWPKP
jgi:hypothetical protein